MPQTEIKNLPEHSSPWEKIRKLLFLMDAEFAHDLGIEFLEIYQSLIVALNLDSQVKAKSYRSCQKWGLHFPNPLGMAAGFDKNARVVLALQALGFGFVEVGTVTPRPQRGNPKPRIFRIPERKALFNCLGFNNVGAEQVARNLERTRKRNKVQIPIGVNLGKNKSTSQENAYEDYQIGFSTLADLADYIVINVSSPNTPGLRDLQGSSELAKIFDRIQSCNAKRKEKRPVLLKLSPDLSDEAIIKVMDVIEEYQIQGLILTNTTTDRSQLGRDFEQSMGGVSGAPLREKSISILKKVRRDHPEQTIISVGGIMSGEDVSERLSLGADLVQVYTGWIYGGPLFPKSVEKFLTTS